ncbi:PREDICTED: protein ARABIDILLO 2-like [Camelina sativa]|uniref:Protein ARABIDILLO 2-like n=1 Tax=Camelina sativa TaxID=90675 RepID=A0ABM0Z9I3_CAMSA|nr:PREDICTED: protein ARABIDILLO 2-like [Camelina sativa]
MSRRVRQRVEEKGKNKLESPSYRYPLIGNDEDVAPKVEDYADWTSLPYDTVLYLFTRLNYRDRASLASTCRTWRSLGASSCLWNSLDLRAHKFDLSMAPTLATRCAHLQKIRFRGVDSADAIIHLRARKLLEISGDYCRKITDATLSMIAARHEALESLQLGPDFCEKITSDAIRVIAFCCPKLKKLRVSGMRDITSEAIESLAKHCPQLSDLGFIDCLNINEEALGKVVSVRYLSVAGTTNIKWKVALDNWEKLPKLTCLDVSRTTIDHIAVSRLLKSSQSLKVLCALNCPFLEEDKSFSSNKFKGKVLLAMFTNTFDELASIFADNSKKPKDIFAYWRDLIKKDKSIDEIMLWIEWIISHTLLRIAESSSQGVNDFWLNQGATLLLSLMQSTQEDVQERAATGLATFIVVDDENASIDCGRAEAVMRDGGIRLLLELAKSWREGLQSEAAKAIANLSVNAKVAKAVADEGGISVLAGLAKSMNRLVAEEAAGGLWNLSVGEEHKNAIAQAGGVNALVDLIFRWPTGCDGVLERAAGALANLAADDKCSTEVAKAGGVHALVMLARNCKYEGAQEQAARALANLAAHGDSNNNNAAVGQEAGALDALVQLTQSLHDGVKQEAAGALWNLSFDDKNRESIAAFGGVEALVALAKSCSNASTGLQERAAGALWGLSVSEANSIAIGRDGGIPPLIALAGSEAEDVHETAAGALWNLAFNPGNALRIVEEGGVKSLVHLCLTSVSKMARFMAALALAYMFDGRMDEYAMIGTSSESASKSVTLNGARMMALKHIGAFIKTFMEHQIFTGGALSFAPSMLAQVAEKARIPEAGHLRCSGSEIGRFVAMLRNHDDTLKACAAFALLQFTIPGGRHAMHHASLMQNAGEARALRSAAAAANVPRGARIFAKIVLRNLEHHQAESSKGKKVSYNRI